MGRTAPPTPPVPATPERRPIIGKVGAGQTPSTEVFTASWCCSVGATWTVELRLVDQVAQGRPAEWICSGVPTQQPAPEYLTADLLAERGLLLFPVEPADPAEFPPRTRCRQLIGYVTRNPEVMRLARMLTTMSHAERDHPMMAAARWVQRGYSARTAARWITAERRGRAMPVPAER